MRRSGPTPSRCRTGARASPGPSCAHGSTGSPPTFTQGPGRRRPRVDLDVQPPGGCGRVPCLRAPGYCLQSLAPSHVHLCRDRPPARAPRRPRARDGAGLGRRSCPRRPRCRPRPRSPRWLRSMSPRAFPAQPSAPRPLRPIPTGSPIWLSRRARRATPSASCTRTTRCSPTPATWYATGGTGPNGAAQLVAAVASHRLGRRGPVAGSGLPLRHQRSSRGHERPRLDHRDGRHLRDGRADACHGRAGTAEGERSRRGSAACRLSTWRERRSRRRWRRRSWRRASSRRTSTV